MIDQITEKVYVGCEYEIKLWGDDGGQYPKKGAYGEVKIRAKKNFTAYINIGDQGKPYYTSYQSAHNGGGQAGYHNSMNFRAASGGDGTDIRINDNKIENRFVAVAGAGGGLSNNLGSPGGGKDYIMNGNVKIDVFGQSLELFQGGTGSYNYGAV